MEDSKRALDLNKMNLTEAAVWLTENMTPEERSKPEEGGLNITGIDVSIRSQEGGNQYHWVRCKCEGPKEGDSECEKGDLILQG